jgi:hypothetical protein
MKTVWLLLATLAASSVALAKEDEARFPKADTPQAFQEVAARVREQMKEGGRFEFVKSTDRQEIERRLGIMAGLLEHAGSVDAMNDRDRMALFTEQEKVNDILTGGDGERLVCQSVAPVGSHIPVRQCSTYAEIERSRRSTNTFSHDAVWSQNRCAPDKPLTSCGPLTGQVGYKVGPGK